MPRATTTPAKNKDTKFSEAMKLMSEAREEKVEQAKEQITKKIDDTKERVQQFSENATETFEKSVKDAEKKVTANPFAYLAGATIFGLLVGFLFGRRR